uniref:SMC5-SMC6 complex localization factor protein 1 isoform X2 n=1 Tax=Myxine glutinosa TaxID=7769 RepID=UPI00358E3777
MVGASALSLRGWWFESQPNRTQDPQMNFSTSCTHLIIKRPDRSEKFLAACAAGIWVLQKDYVLESAQIGHWLNEENFEWLCEPGDVSASAYPREVSHLWRKHIATQGGRGAFFGWKVVLEHFVDEQLYWRLLRILLAGQAKIYPRIPPDKDVTFVIRMDKLTFSPTVEGLPCVTATYICKHLLKGPILSPDKSLRANGAGVLARATSRDRNPEEAANDLLSTGSALGSFEQQTCCEIQEEPLTDGLPCVPIKKFRSCREDTEGMNNVPTVPLNKRLERLSNFISSKQFMCSLYHRSCTLACGFSRTRECRQVRKMTQSAVKRVQNKIDCEYFTQALSDVRSNICVKLRPPEMLMHNILQHILRKCDVLMMSQFADMFQRLLTAFPPGSAKDMADYYMNVLFYKQGCDHDNDGWNLLKKAVKMSFTDVTECPEKSQLKEVYIKLLSCFIALFEFELFFINIRNTEESLSDSTTLGPFVLEKLFYTNSGIATLTCSGIEWLGQQLVEQFRTTQDNVTAMNVVISECLGDMLSVIVEFLFLWNKISGVQSTFLRNFAYFLAVLSSDLTTLAIGRFVKSIGSPWLQMEVCRMILELIFEVDNVQTEHQSSTLHGIVHSFVNIKSMKRKTFIQQVSSDRKRGLQEESSTPRNGSADKLADDACCSINRKGETKLHAACINNDVKGLSQLLSIPGIDINVQDNAGWTPLHEACLHGHTACVEAILNMQPDVNLMIGVKGVTPIHDAVMSGNRDIVELLVRHAGSTFLHVHLNNNITVLDLLKGHFPQEGLARLIEDVEHATDKVCVKGNACGDYGAVNDTKCSHNIEQTRDHVLMLNQRPETSGPFSSSCANDQEVYCLLVFLMLKNYIWVNRLHRLTCLAVAEGGEMKDKLSILMRLSCQAHGPIASYLEDLRILVELPQYVTLLHRSLEKSLSPHPLSKRTREVLHNILVISSSVSKPEHGKYFSHDEH